MKLDLKPPIKIEAIRETRVILGRHRYIKLLSLFNRVLKATLDTLDCEPIPFSYYFSDYFEIPVISSSLLAPRTTPECATGDAPAITQPTIN